MAGSGRKPTAKRPRASKSRADAGFTTVTLDPALATSLGALQSLPEFLGTVSALTRDERLVLVDQAQVMIDQTYVHLPLKRAMHAIDPVQRLRLLRQRIDNYEERAFHDEMISIFVHLRDLHTNYVLPEPFRNRVAFLPFEIEECFAPATAGEEPVPQYLITQVSGTATDPGFAPGAVVTHWNGTPIGRAIDLNAEREAGSNLDARHLGGLRAMTNRWLGMSLPPDEEWVVLRYLPAKGAASPRDARFEWQVFMPEPGPSGGGGAVPGADRAVAADPERLRLGIDAKAEMQRRVRKLLFAPAAVAVEQRMVALGAGAPAAARAFHALVLGADRASVAALTARARSGTPPRKVEVARSRRRNAELPKAGTGDEAATLAAGAMLEGVDLSTTSIMPDVIKEFGKISNAKGTFGYIRIVTFSIAGGDVRGFIEEIVRIMTLLPQDGLIIDVRGNGGGYIAAGEGLLQTMTPLTIEPERFHLINTPLVQKMCEQGGELETWRESVADAVQSATTFSKGFPLTTHEFCNSIGQIYQGPVVLIIDAGCYSTTDIFSAGFQDHSIGKIIGTSGHTGAGGANVWEHADLEQSLPSDVSPFRPLPQGASFRVAIRRSTRVGARSGDPVEDYGVVPDLPLYRMTRNDVLAHNQDLIAYACDVLAAMPRQHMRVTKQSRAGAEVKLTVRTAGIDRFDTLLGARPIQTLDVNDGEVTIALTAPAGNAGQAAIELRGFRSGALVASTRLTA